MKEREKEKEKAKNRQNKQFFLFKDNSSSSSSSFVWLHKVYIRAIYFSVWWQWKIVEHLKWGVHCTARREKNNNNNKIVHIREFHWDYPFYPCPLRFNFVKAFPVFAIVPRWCDVMWSTNPDTQFIPTRSFTQSDTIHACIQINL